MSHYCTGGRLQYVRDCLNKWLRLACHKPDWENLFEWEQGQTHRPEQMKNERADLLLPGLVSAGGWLYGSTFDLQKSRPKFP